MQTFFNYKNCYLKTTLIKQVLLKKNQNKMSFKFNLITKENIYGVLGLFD